MANLLELIEAHRAAIAEYDACDDDYWDTRKDEINRLINTSTRALLNHRPTSTTEVLTKAEYMASAKAFVEWDDVDVADVIHSLTPRVSIDAPEAEWKAVVARFIKARAEQEKAARDGNEEGPAWDEYEAAEKVVIDYPCRTIDEVREKARFFLENEDPYDTIRNCYSNEGETLRRFLQSLMPAPVGVSPIMALFRQWNELRDRSDEEGISDEEVHRRCVETDAVMLQLATLPPTSALDFAAKLSCITHYGHYDDLGGDAQGTGSALIREAAAMVGHPEHVHDRHAEEEGGAS